MPPPGRRSKELCRSVGAPPGRRSKDCCLTPLLRPDGDTWLLDSSCSLTSSCLIASGPTSLPTRPRPLLARSDRAIRLCRIETAACCGVIEASWPTDQPSSPPPTGPSSSGSSLLEQLPISR
eukprot:scaffold36153_cov48-Phaeocystis_antarctica.AAC.2